MLKWKLHWQVLLAMILGCILGSVLKSFDSVLVDPIYQIITLLGTIFVRLLKMVMVPLIFTSIILGVSSIGSGKKVSRIGIKTLIYYLCTSLLAIITGLLLSNLIKPGIGANIVPNAGFDPSKIQPPGSTLDILIRMIPTNPFQALASGDMLGIIFFAIFFGIVLNMVADEKSKLLRDIIDSIFSVIMKITQIIISLAPIGVMGLMTKTVYSSGFDIFINLAKYMLTIALGLSIHLFIILPLILFFFLKINPIIHFKAMASAMLTAFSTSSSSATLPVTMKCVEENVGVSNEVSSFVLPMGATVNMDGTALYECAGVLFIAQYLGVSMGIDQQLVIVITALLASIGAAGIPSAGLVMIFIVTSAVGLTGPEVGIIVGAMLAIDRPLDMFRTMVNVTSDSIGSVVIAKSEGEDLYS
tara:strand:+ start:1351 stop:2595 length:1245 start_codon:yes stop_codon:yes gene_type:complete